MAAQPLCCILYYCVYEKNLVYLPDAENTKRIRRLLAVVWVLGCVIGMIGGLYFNLRYSFDFFKIVVAFVLVGYDAVALCVGLFLFRHTLDKL